MYEIHRSMLHVATPLFLQLNLFCKQWSAVLFDRLGNIFLGTMALRSISFLAAVLAIPALATEIPDEECEEDPGVVGIEVNRKIQTEGVLWIYAFLLNQSNP